MYTEPRQYQVFQRSKDRWQIATGLTRPTDFQLLHHGYPTREAAVAMIVQLKNKNNLIAVIDYHEDLFPPQS